MRTLPHIGVFNHSTRVRTRPKGVSCGHFSTYRSRKASALLRALRPKLHRNPRLLGRRIFGSGIFVSARQNRSQSFRIDEDFNKAEAEILPRKSCSDVCAMVKLRGVERNMPKTCFCGGFSLFHRCRAAVCRDF